MIQLIYAMKGSGKAKRLIDMTNEEVNNATGDVVFIDDDKRYMYDVKYRVRFCDVSEYGIRGEDEFYGFLCGMVSQNFDIQAIYIDAFLKIIEKDAKDTENLIGKIKKLTDDNNIKAVIIVSGDPEEAPEHLKEYMI